jgi:hypothetical protein
MVAGPGSEAVAVVAPRPAAGRRRRQQPGRRHRVEFSLDDAEFAALCEAAGRAGLSRGAYAARAAAGAVAGRQGGGQLLREALAELVRCTGQVRKIGGNLNQAVAKLNATGQSDRGLVPYAAASIRIAGHLEDAAEQVRKAAVR